MAVVQNFNNQDQNSQQQSQGQNQFVPVSVSGTSASPTSSYGSSAAPTVSGSNKPSSSGVYNNLKNYLNANKDFNQSGGGLAGQINNTIENKATGIQQQAQQSQQQFEQQANANRNQYNSSLVNQAVADPSKFLQNQSNVDALTKLQNTTYQGPTALSNQQQLLGQAQDLSSTANLGNTESGRYALLSKLYNTPTYSLGQQKLDNLLLQGNPEQLQKLSNLNNVAATANTNVQNAINQANTLGQQYQQEADTTRSQTTGALQNSLQGLMGQATSAQDAAKAQEQSRLNALNTFNKALSSNNYASALGALKDAGTITNDQADQLYSAIQNSNPQAKAQIAQFLGQNLNGTSASGLDTTANFLNNGQISNANALTQLLGQTNILTPDQYKAGSLNFNVNNLLNTLAPYQTQMEPPKGMGRPGDIINNETYGGDTAAAINNILKNGRIYL